MMNYEDPTFPTAPTTTPTTAQTAAQTAKEGTAQAWETTANLRTRKDILEQAVAAAAPFTADPVEIKVDADLIKEVSAKLAAAEKTLALSNTVLLLANASAECCRLCKATALPKARKTEIETNNADLSKTVDALRKEYTAVTTDQQASQALINKAATDRASWQASRERALGELRGHPEEARDDHPERRAGAADHLRRVVIEQRGFLVQDRQAVEREAGLHCQVAHRAGRAALVAHAIA